MAAYSTAIFLIYYFLLLPALKRIFSATLKTKKSEDHDTLIVIASGTYFGLSFFVYKKIVQPWAARK